MDTEIENYTIDDWLNEYQSNLDSLSNLEQRQEQREDYREDSQTYADYLDYVDEWNWYNKENQRNLLSSFIQYSAKTHQYINCSCEKQKHILTTVKEPSAGDIVVDDPKIHIYAKCWFKQLTRDVKSVLEHNAEEIKRVKMNPVLERVMTNVSEWRMINQDQTPILLPYEAFKQLWWNKDLKGEQTTLSKYLESQISRKEKHSLDIQRSQNILAIPNEGKKILLNFPHSSHGFHILYDTLGNAVFTAVWSFMNTQRKRIDPESSIDIRKFFDKRRRCKLCRQRKYTPGLSPLGIYYAPPGSGKTTMADQELFVGFDTDWIGVGPTWLDYSYLLNLKIPLLTNQYKQFRSCGLKVIGIVRKDIRKDARGIPLGRRDDILRYEKDHPQEMNFISVDNKEFFTHYTNQIKIQQHLQLMMRNYVINLLPFYQNEQTTDWINKFPKLLKQSQT